MKKIQSVKDKKDTTIKTCLKCGEIVTFINNQDIKVCPRCQEVIYK